jgi:3-methyladenine DNA glycosylase AlkD
MPALTAASIEAKLREAPPTGVEAWRALRRGWSRELRSEPGTAVVKIARHLNTDVPWSRLTAYELIVSHPSAVQALTTADVLALGRSLANWGSVDAFACYVAGPAWREGRLPTRQIETWLRSSNRWLRRTAVVCTVALNVPARGGSGDVGRTLAVCRSVAADRDDMVVKALSWALRSLIRWDANAVAVFLAKHEQTLAPRVKREVRTKLRTGRKT